MTSTNLIGPYRLDYDGVTSAIGDTVAGAFALGYERGDGIFRINYVGSSRDSLRAQLLDRIGSDQLFKFRICATAEQAFHDECMLFHDFHPPLNRIHPARPAGTDWVCPRCLQVSTRRR